MGKRLVFSMVISVIVVLGLLLAGCGGGGESTPTPPPGETVDEMLARGASIASVKYDMVMASPGRPAMTAKVWAKGGNTRTEMTYEGRTGIIIVNRDKQVSYMYFPAENTAEKAQIQPGAPKGFQEISPVEWAEVLADTEPAVVGTESMDRKDCLVVEATDPNGMTMKVWVWKKYGFPIRIEIAFPDGKMTLEYKNAEGVNIPDDMFELPPGVQIK